MLICIVEKSVVDNVLKDYQKTIVFETILMAGFILLLFAGLFCSISRRSLAEQKAEYEKRNNEIQTQAMKEMEESNKKLKKQRTLQRKPCRPLKMQIRRKQISCPICHMIFVHQ